MSRKGLVRRFHERSRDVFYFAVPEEASDDAAFVVRCGNSPAAVTFKELQSNINIWLELLGRDCEEKFLLRKCRREPAGCVLAADQLRRRPSLYFLSDCFN
ncbi:Protein of unknown function [Gryllus bimaculatus]|nr:Protein of unknown function [Gryllus bimaculatus]